MSEHIDISSSLSATDTLCGNNRPGAGEWYAYYPIATVPTLVTREACPHVCPRCLAVADKLRHGVTLEAARRELPAPGAEGGQP